MSESRELVLPSKAQHAIDLLVQTQKAQGCAFWRSVFACW
jgi:hypothetical protein